jgi:hypothetical protein
METSKSAASKAPREPCRFTKRLGSTTYRVAVHFNPNAKGTVGERIARLARNEMTFGVPAATQRSGCRGGRRSDGVSELSGLPGSGRYEVRDDERAANR